LVLNMAHVNYPTSSPYYLTPQNSWRIGYYVDRPIPADSTDTVFTVTPKYQYRPDKLSYDIYGYPVYYWVFMQRNIDIIRDPIYDMIVGITIYIPTYTRLQNLGF